MKHGCLYLPFFYEGGHVPVIDSSEAKKTVAKRLYGWQYALRTPKEIVLNGLDGGRAIVPGEFVVCPEKKKFRHMKSLWRGTSLVMADADNIKCDADPDGWLEPFTKMSDLFKHYPRLQKEVYAVSHSVNSQSLGKPPPHTRARLTFLLETPITSSEDFTFFLRGLSQRYPIISGAGVHRPNLSTAINQSFALSTRTLAR